MVRVSDLYFDALEQDNGDIIPLWDGCNRIENSMQTTNNPGLFPRDPNAPRCLRTAAGRLTPRLSLTSPR